MSGYEPCREGESVGWLTFAGTCRYRYIIARPGRGNWRTVKWRKLFPQRFRGHRGAMVDEVEAFWVNP